MTLCQGCGLDLARVRSTDRYLFEIRKGKQIVICMSVCAECSSNLFNAIQERMQNADPLHEVKVGQTGRLNKISLDKYRTYLSKHLFQWPDPFRQVTELTKHIAIEEGLPKGRAKVFAMKIVRERTDPEDMSKKVKRPLHYKTVQGKTNVNYTLSAATEE